MEFIVSIFHEIGRRLIIANRYPFQVLFITAVYYIFSAVIREK